ncbi:MAG: hypothetical protein IKE30_05215 [Clostridia bacterium]|nr:hypothetical protein [Clostridia bacterium]
MVFAAALYLYACFSIFRVRREGQNGQETFKPWPLAVFFLCAGLPFAVPAFLFRGAWFFAFFALFAGYASLLASNCRIRWDSRGFRYRTAVGREIRFGYEKISRMCRIRLSPFSEDLVFRAGRRLICLDSMQGWERFASAYDSWRTRNGQVPWREAERKRWLEQYLRHGAFGRKLDRIPGGRFLLASMTVCGAGLAASGARYLSATRPEEPGNPVIAVLAAAFLAAGAVLPAGYVLGVAHMDKRILRLYTRSRILPDPLNPEAPKHRSGKRKG